jgi:hypothetical protein
MLAHLMKVQACRVGTLQLSDHPVRSLAAIDALHSLHVQLTGTQCAARVCCGYQRLMLHSVPYQIFDGDAMQAMLLRHLEQQLSLCHFTGRLVHDLA